MKTMTATALRKDLYQSLDKVVETGVPIEVKRRGKRLKIVLADEVDKFANLVRRNSIVGDPDELVDIKPYVWEPDKNL